MTTLEKGLNAEPPLGIGTQGPPRDTDYANIKGAYAYLGVSALTNQEELFLLTRARGMSIAASARASGMSNTKSYNILKRPEVDKILEYFSSQLYDDARITLEMLNSMTLEAHRKSVTATEEIKAVETLGRLNEIGGYASVTTQKVRAEQAGTKEKDVTPNSVKALESMSTDKLLKMAAIDGLEDLDPSADTTDEDDDDDGAAIEGDDEYVIEGESHRMDESHREDDDE